MRDKEKNNSLKNQDKNFNENFTQEKEQIMIDRVDVNKCERHCSDNYNTPNMCYSDITRGYRHCNPKENQCDFYITSIEEQLARKTQECEELKNIIAYPKYRNEIAIKELENKTKKELIEEIVHRHQIGESTVHCVYAPLREENNRYRKALEEIERELKEDIYCESQECGCDDYEECLRCTKNIILDIINKAKGNNHEADKD